MTQIYEILQYVGDANRQGYCLSSRDVQKGLNMEIATVTSYLNKLWKWGHLNREKDLESKRYFYTITTRGVGKVKQKEIV